MKKQHIHKRQYTLHGQTVEYTLRRSKRARHILLHVDVRGNIELVVPWRVSYTEAEKFVLQKQEWLERMGEKQAHIRRQLPQRQYISGEVLPFFGREFVLDVQLDISRKRSFCAVAGNTVTIFAQRQALVRPALVRWYRSMSREYMAGHVERYGNMIGEHASKLRIVDTKTQWGSCARHSKTISLNWRLALAPEDVAQYVIAHEVAHLQVPNHSKKFWNVVNDLCPLYMKHRIWLKQYGFTLVL